MKRIVLGIIPMLACLLFTGCKDDELGNRVKEGLPVSLTFRMTVPQATEVKTRATDEQETNVEKLGLVFYKYGDSKGQVIQVPSNQISKPTHVSETHYTYTISITQEQMEAAGINSGTYANLIAIANWDKGFCTVSWNDLQGLTLNELKEYCVLKANNQTELIETALLLTGEYGQVTLAPAGDKGGTTLKDLHLKRSTAKITFNFKNGNGANFTPVEYEIHNYSNSSTLVERQGWTLGNGNENNIAGTNPGKLEYKGKEGASTFIESTAPIQVTNGNIIFYMLENVQTAKNTISDNNWAMREKRVSVSDRTFANAPEKGTYVIIKGTYSGVTSPTNATPANGNVTYTIHLGDFSSKTGSLNNYTVRRNTKYTYDVTVNGVNSIKVEAESKNFDDEENPAVEGSILSSQKNVFDLDAHFETVMMKIPTDVNIDDYTLLVNTPYGMFTGQYDNTGNIDSPVDAEHVAWVKFGKPTSKDAFAAYPGESTFQAGADAIKNTTVELIDVNGLLALLNTDNSQYRDRFFVTATDEKDGKDYYWVTAYVDEYYYDDEEDYGKFINAANRKMALSTATSVSPDKHSSYTVSPIFSLTQRSIKSPFNIAEAGNLSDDEFFFGTESVEETGPTTLTKDGNEPTYPYGNAPRLNWGWRNLWEQLDGYGTSGENKQNFKWNTYVNEAKNGHWENFDNSHEGADHTHPYLSAMQDTYSYGLYQCFSRNRDENGDGCIDIDEMKWFLPAIQECISIWEGEDMLPEESRLHYEKYFSSTNSRYRIWWALEGTAFGDCKGQIANVRCIRMFGDYGKKNTEHTVSSSTYNENTQVIRVEYMAKGTTRTAGSQVGEYTNHDLWGIQNKLPEMFQIAKKDLEYGNRYNKKSTFTHDEILNQNLCATYYSEASDESDLGQWRIPNQRELTQMFKHCKESGADFESNSSLNNWTVARTTYKREGKGDALFYIEMDSGGKQFITTSWGVTGNTIDQDQYSDFKIRCVRDYVQ